MKYDKTVAANIAKAILPLVYDITLRRAVVFMASGDTVKATRQRKYTRNSRTETILFTYGAPNYAEREVIKRAKKNGKKLGLVVQSWPKKKVKKV